MVRRSVQVDVNFISKSISGADQTTMVVFLFALTAVILAAGAVDSSRRHRSARPRPTAQGFAVVDALVIGLMLSITAAVLVLAIVNIRSV